MVSKPVNYSDAPLLTRTQRKWLIWIACNPDSHFPDSAWDGANLFDTLYNKSYIGVGDAGWIITDAGLEALASYDADEETDEPAGDSGGETGDVGALLYE